MLWLMIIMIISNSLFLSMNHPLTMGLMLIIQTLLIALFSSVLVNSFWFSYILILIFLGGLLILFIYVATLASNEQMNINPPQTTSTLFVLSMMIILFYFNPSKIFSFTDNQEDSMIFSWMFSSNFLGLSSFLIIYLFFVLIAVVKITKYWTGTLRTSL